MADFAGQVFSAAAIQGVLDSRDGETLVSATTVFFKMVGQDKNNSNKDTWEVTGTADFTGAQYTGLLTTPLRNVAVSDTWVK